MTVFGTILEGVGLLALVVAAYLVAVPLAVATLGVSLILIGIALTKPEAEATP